jgi:branched-chain amino acid transport system substrate-binding protein
MADSWSEVITPAFQERVKLLGKRIAFSEQVSPSQTDFRSLVPRIKSANTEAVFLPLYGASLTSAIRQLRVGGFKGTLLTGDSMSELEVEQAGAENAEGMYLSQMWREDTELEKRYIEINPERPSAIHLGLAALGYDSYICVSRAAKRLLEQGSVPVTGEKLRDELRSLPCQGIAGTVDYKATRISSRREKILKVSAGKLLPVKEFRDSHSIE